MKKIAILQSNYIPWKGYFDLIAAVDEFVFYDDVQFTKNDWRNRNKIKTPQGIAWLTIPVGDHIHREIREVSPMWLAGSSRSTWARHTAISRRLIRNSSLRYAATLVYKPDSVIHGISKVLKDGSND